MNFLVAAYGKEDVKSGILSKILFNFTQVVNETNETISKKGLATGDLVEVLILSTEGSSAPSKGELKTFGNYYIFIFFNPIAAELAKLHNIELNYVGELVQPPKDAIILMRNYVIGK